MWKAESPCHCCCLYRGLLASLKCLSCNSCHCHHGRWLLGLHRKDQTISFPMNKGFKIVQQTHNWVSIVSFPNIIMQLINSIKIWWNSDVNLTQIHKLYISFEWNIRDHQELFRLSLNRPALGDLASYLSILFPLSREGDLSESNFSVSHIFPYSPCQNARRTVVS